MIKEAIEYLVGLNELKTTEIHGQTYTNHELIHIAQPKHTQPQPITFNTLTGFADYIKDNKEPEEITKDFAMVRVKDHSLAALSGLLQADNFNGRFDYASAQLDIDAFSFMKWYSLETFVIALQSQFEPSEPANQILDYLGNLANAHVRENIDDGFTQTIQIRTGVITKSNATIENPLTLKPYRTFLEVDQPESKCILRLRESNGLECALHIADGGMWKLEAIKNIAEWLKTNLDNKVTVMA